MKKSKIRCVVEYIDVNGTFNNKIYKAIGGGWSSNNLASCLNCGEIYIYNEQQLHFNNIDLKQLANGLKCPKCMNLLTETIERYPDSFRASNGTIGHLQNNSINPDKSMIIEFWEI